MGFATILPYSSLKVSKLTGHYNLFKNFSITLKMNNIFFNFVFTVPHAFFKKYIFQHAAGCSFLLTLFIGVVFGFSFAYLLLITSRFSIGDFSSLSFGDPHHHSDLYNVPGPELSSFGTHSNDEEFHKGEDTVARQMAEKVKVLCWIMTSPKTHEHKARHVKATWGRRCNTILFMSSVNDTSLPSVKLPVSEGRNYLWAKTKEAFLYVYKHHLSDADWFLKADDDVYVIVENLRYMLSNYKPTDPWYFGCRFKPHVKQGYMSGGAGYVLSREAVRRLIEEGLPDKTKCRPDHGRDEDIEMGKCLERIGVKAGDSRDAFGRGRFFPFLPEQHLIPDHTYKDYWYWKYIYYESKEGLECCSDSAISFHYVTPNHMYVLEYLIYHLRPYGINHFVEQPVTEKQTDIYSESKSPKSTK